jgi:hypothetical protein
MRILSSLILIPFCFILSILRSDNEYICWNENYKLSWNDFKGVVDTSSWVTANSKITISYYTDFCGNKIIFTIKVIFIKNESWVKPGAKNPLTLLQHEQGHFDLTEVFARKLRKAIGQSKFTDRDYSQQIAKLFEGLNNECNKENDKYDMETNFSMDSTNQTKWLVLIRTELKKNKRFAPMKVENRFYRL